MAVDTRSKRASVLGIGLAAALTLPLSDGTVGQPDRQHVSFAYPGITAESVSSAEADIIVTVAAFAQVVQVPPFVEIVRV
jgi:hypothetical protein